MKNTKNILVNHMPAENGQSFVIGVMSVRVMEDGSHTYKRIGAAEIKVLANMPQFPLLQTLGVTRLFWSLRAISYSLQKMIKLMLPLVATLLRLLV